MQARLGQSGIPSAFSLLLPLLPLPREVFVIGRQADTGLGSAQYILILAELRPKIHARLKILRQRLAVLDIERTRIISN